MCDMEDSKDRELCIEVPQVRIDMLRAKLRGGSETVRGDIGLTCGELRWLLDVAERKKARQLALLGIVIGTIAAILRMLQQLYS